MYEIYALKVAEVAVDSPHMFFQTDYGKKTTIYYYFFCLKGEGRTILLDTGIPPDEVAFRGITGTSREELLSRIDVKPRDVEAIILTHLHGDHFGGPEIYPDCVFYVQRKEFEYWSEDVQRFHNIFIHKFPKGDSAVAVETLQKLNFQGRVRFLDGDMEVYPGIRTIWCGAHTPGSQMVTVQTARGTVLCGSDFLDYYRNLDEQIPVGILTSLVEWLQGVVKIEMMRLPREAIIPGHDPVLMTMFPRVAEGVIKIA
jgi:glyoxylase-like metal-dependent hydrolase (beta-lactamase superfamily II)